MPIYEFLCSDCNRIFSFVVPSMADERLPQCPQCGAADLEKQVSLFAFIRGGTDPLAAIPKHLVDGSDEDHGPVRDDGLYTL